MKQEYPKMLYGTFPEYVLVNCPEEESEYIAQGYTWQAWNAREVVVEPSSVSQSFACPICGKNAASHKGLKRHMTNQHCGSSGADEQSIPGQMET